MLAEGEARIPIRDRGYRYGDGCFETVRIHRGAPFRPEAHFARLRQSLEILRIESRWSSRELLQAARKIVETNRIEEGLLRITLSAPEGNAPGSASITSRELPAMPDRPALHVATSARRISGPLSQCKSIARAAESVALREAQEEGAFDAILLNEKGRVVETTARNLFILSAGSLLTPPTYDGALAGVTRGLVLELAASAGLRTRQASLTVDRVRAAEELFLTGTGVGVLGIAALDGHQYRIPGPITEQLRNACAASLDTESKW